MEKFVRILSACITAALLYGVGAYMYLTDKGFKYVGGDFVLIPAAQAAPTEESSENKLAAPLADNVSINYSYPAILGDENAPRTLYEFSSLGCSHCADFHLSVLPRLQKEYIDTGRLKVIFVNFPLEKKSMAAAMLFECLPANARHDFLNTVFAKQRDWMLSYNYQKILTEYAVKAGLDNVSADKCLKDNKLATEIITNRQEAIDNFKINGTPAFVISGKNKNEIIYGVPSFDSLTAYLNERLSEE